MTISLIKFQLQSPGRWLLFVFFLNCILSVNAQKSIPQNYFSPPLKGSRSLTGSFAEIRPNHFHSGIDYKVGGQEGMPIYSIADGFVSRLRVSEVGFGKAIYIDHPNGFTSVYGHLKDYESALLEVVRSRQYKEKSFAIDWFPARERDSIFVKKGQLIGYVGNSGSSSGPHLHFEIRNTQTERTINPLKFGIPVTDDYPPFFTLFKVYPENSNSYINNGFQPKRFSVSEVSAGKFKIAGTDTLKVWGKVSFGVQAFDYMYAAGDRNGCYSVEMLIDNKPFYSMVADSFSFAESRYVNACIDYAENFSNSSRILVSKKLPGNIMSMHNTYGGDGSFDFTDQKLHNLEIKATDYSGKVSVLKVLIASRMPEAFIAVPLTPAEDWKLKYSWKSDNTFKGSGIEVVRPAGSLYDDIDFSCEKSGTRTGLYSPVYQVCNPNIPLQKGMQISIDASGVPAGLRSKACLVRLSESGKLSYVGGRFSDGNITASTNVFGKYAIGSDSAKPVIKALNLAEKNKKSLRFTVTDNFSGIGSYKLELNGQWALLEYDPKNRLMTYKFDTLVKKGSNSISLEVTDNMGNTARFNGNFVTP